jgi:PAS domain S-box-containing protein
VWFGRQLPFANIGFTLKIELMNSQKQAPTRAMQFRGFDASLSARALMGVGSAIVVSDAIDPETPIVYVNPAFEVLTGHSREEVVGRNCRFLQGPDDNQPAKHIIRDAIAKQHAASCILRNYRKDESLFSISCSSIPFATQMASLPTLSAAKTRSRTRSVAMQCRTQH